MFVKIRDRYCWPAMLKNVAKHIKCYSSCQHRVTSHRPPKLPDGDCPVSGPFRCVAIVKYKSSSNNSKYVMSVIDHITCFVVVGEISGNRPRSCSTCFLLFSTPETLHSDFGCQFENELVKGVQSYLGSRRRARQRFAHKETSC